MTGTAAFGVERVFHRDGLRVAEGLIAAISIRAGAGSVCAEQGAFVRWWVGFRVAGGVWW
ncbi:hypothetical protein GCM10022226_63690 [Sphaerisporangium flaviroseum]|uniref:Uncharacterized protein n=1 Tax=Sphaerisporangium flaviroseum TaxID=509199 RepID=A0ABP7J4C7_9ACTN